MTQGERINEIRKSLNLTMEKFGDKLGVTKSAINKIEKNERVLTDQMAKSICREFNVNYDYLVNGEGEMFSDLPKTILDELCVQYDLSDFDRLLVEMYISLSPQERVSIHAPTKGATAISAKNSFQFSAVINKLLFSITNFPLFHPFFFTFLLHLCIFYSANLPTFSCPPPIRTLILSQNQCVIHCNSSIDTHMLHFGLILIPQIIESQTVNTFIDNICQNCLQSNTLGIIQNTFKYRILNSSPIICALFCNFPQPLSSRSSLSIHIICDQYKHSPTSLPQEYRISVQITS